MSKVKNLVFKISPDNLKRLIDTLKNLSGIDSKVIFKIDKKHVLIYSLVGERKTINAFKSFIFETNDIFDVSDFDDTINYINKDIKELYRKLHILSTFDQDITGKISYDSLGDDFYAESISFKASTKLKLSFYGGDPMAINTDISVEKIKETIDTDNANFKFKLSGDDLANIKRLSSPNADIDIFYMNTKEVNDKWQVSIGESSWDLKVDDVDVSYESTLAFPKKYFKTITMGNNGTSDVYVFDNFLMVSTENSDFIISIEITV